MISCFFKRWGLRQFVAVVCERRRFELNVTVQRELFGTADLKKCISRGDLRPNAGDGDKVGGRKREHGGGASGVTGLDPFLDG